jgi:hypothetical protein
VDKPSTEKRGKTLIREVLLASVHKNKNYHHSNGRMTFRVEESVSLHANFCADQGLGHRRELLEFVN